MIYKINSDYYILVDSKYVKVDFNIQGDNVTLVPNRKEFIENNPGVVAIQYTFDDEFKKGIKKSKESKNVNTRVNDNDKIFGKRNKNR